MDNNHIKSHNEEKDPLCIDETYFSSEDGDTYIESTQEDNEDFVEYMESKEKGTYLSSEEVIATDEDGIETTFEDITHASRSLGISIENITKCCKNIRGYEYITVNDKKYRFKY